MRAFIVVVIDPFIQIILQLLDGLVDLLSECYLVELLQDGFVEPFADAVGLGVNDGVKMLSLLFITSALPTGLSH